MRYKSRHPKRFRDVASQCGNELVGERVKRGYIVSIVSHTRLVSPVRLAVASARL
jgi:hypothetical protein